MKLAATDLTLIWTRDELAAWENEGGAIKSAPKPLASSVTMFGWGPASTMDPAPTRTHGADMGITDTNSLTILRISLLLLVPALAAIAIFWSNAAMSASQ